MLAEELGLDAFAVGERHAGDFLSSSPTVLLGAIAAGHVRILLSTGVTVLSPARPGPGGRGLRHDRRALPRAAGDRHRQGQRGQAVPAVRAGPRRSSTSTSRRTTGCSGCLLSEEDVDWEGRFHRPDLTDATTLPRPYDGPFRIWHGSATSHVRGGPGRAARRPIVSANALQPRENYQVLIDRYREQYAAHGLRPGVRLRRLRLRRPVPGGHHRAGHRGVPRRLRGLRGAAGLRTARRRDASGKVSSLPHIEDAVERGPALVGSPERVAEKILDYHRSYGHDLQSVSINPVLRYDAAARRPAAVRRGGRATGPCRGVDHAVGPGRPGARPRARGGGRVSRRRRRRDYPDQMTTSLEQPVQDAVETPDVVAQVRAVAERAKVASRALATATRATKDAALHAHGGRPRRGHRRDRRGQRRRPRARPEQRDLRRPARPARADAGADRGDRRRAARARRAARPGGRGRPRLDAAQRPAPAAGARADGRRRHDLRGAPERDRRRRRPGAQERQRRRSCGAARPRRRRNEVHRRRAGEGARRAGAARRRWCSRSTPGGARARSRSCTRAAWSTCWCRAAARTSSRPSCASRRCPSIETGVGNCHVYVDATADLAMSPSPILLNSKTQRVGRLQRRRDAAGARRRRADEFLPAGARRAGRRRASPCTATSATAALAPDGGRRACRPPTRTGPPSTSSLDLAVRVVDSLDEAIEHIRDLDLGSHRGDRHAATSRASERFVAELDSAAIMVNASTRFTDGGQFGPRRGDRHLDPEAARPRARWAWPS